MSEFAELIKEAYGTQPEPQTDPTNQETTPENGAGAPPQEQQNSTEDQVAENGGGQSAKPEVTEPEVQNPPAGDNQQPTFDWGYLSERTEGSIKDEDSFNEILNRSKEYETLSTKLAELESNQAKFANPFTEGLNKLYAEGANQNQIDAYIEINRVGDFSKMEPRELLIAREVMINGTSRKVAEFRVDSKYNAEDLEEGSIEHDALMDDQRLEAKKAMQELEKYKADASVVPNNEKQSQEEQRLSEIANQEQWNKSVKQAIPNLVKEAPTATKVGEGESQISFDYTDDFKKNLPSLTEKFFEISGADPTEKGIQEKVNNFIDARYWIENKNDIIADVIKRTESRVTEAVVSKYENNGGTRREENNPNPAAENVSYNDWREKRFGGGNR